MNILVSGANGYIGRNFINYFHKIEPNGKVIAFVRKKTDFFEKYDFIKQLEIDLSEYSNLEKLPYTENIDVFYHFAWNGTTGKLRADYSLQTLNAKYVCDAALLSKRLGCSRFITTGTITENIAESILTKEYTAQNLFYGLAKLYSHKMLDIICRQNDIRYIWAKLSNIYGGDNKTGNLISYTMNELQENRIPTFGPCLQPYNFTHIEDVCNALYLLGSKENTNNCYFISDGDCRLLKDYLQVISKLCCKPINIGYRPDDGLRYSKDWFDNSHLAELGFKSDRTFEQNIEILRRI